MSADSESFDLSASPPPLPPAPSGKARPYLDYVPIYGKQVRTIKWWVQVGRNAPGGPDLPPLDDPAAMPVWWARTMKQACPPSVLDAARIASARLHTPPPVPDAPQPALEATTPPSASASPPIAPAISTQEENLLHLKEQLAVALRELRDAENATPFDASVVETKQRKWRELRTEVEDAESAYHKLRKAQGKLVELEAVEKTLMPLLATVVDSVRSTYTRVRVALAVATTDEEKDKIWNAALDAAFSDLQQSGFIHADKVSLAA